MDNAEAQFVSMAGVVHVLQRYLEQYNIPDRRYLSVNICKRCVLSIVDCCPKQISLDGVYGRGLITFMGMMVNNSVSPVDCIICRGKG